MVDSMNWNAKVVLMISPLFMVSVSLTGTPIAAFVLLLTKKNWEVGLASGVSGIATLIVGPFAGWAADRLGRQGVLRFASVFTFVASGFLCTWLLLPAESQRMELYEMLLSVPHWRAPRHPAAALDAIFGDSVPSGVVRGVCIPILAAWPAVPSARSSPRASLLCRRPLDGV